MEVLFFPSAFLLESLGESVALSEGQRLFLRAFCVPSSAMYRMVYGAAEGCVRRRRLLCRQYACPPKEGIRLVSELRCALFASRVRLLEGTCFYRCIASRICSAGILPALCLALSFCLCGVRWLDTALLRPGSTGRAL
jgi:hypothetical protein